MEAATGLDSSLISEADNAVSAAPPAQLSTYLTQRSRSPSAGSG